MLHFEELEGNEKKLKGKECSYIQKKLASRTNKKNKLTWGNIYYSGLSRFYCVSHWCWPTISGEKPCNCSLSLSYFYMVAWRSCKHGPQNPGHEENEQLTHLTAVPLTLTFPRNNVPALRQAIGNGFFLNWRIYQIVIKLWRLQFSLLTVTDGGIFFFVPTDQNYPQVVEVES